MYFLFRLRSPNFKKANYELFDIPHEEQSLISSAERNAKSPEKPKTLEEVFSEIVVYVGKIILSVESYFFITINYNFQK